LIYQQRIRITNAPNTREAFSRQLIESQEAERKRIAAGCTTISGSISSSSELGFARFEFCRQDCPVREQLDEISTTAVQALNEVRNHLRLAPVSAETIGLGAPPDSW
jgi:hypothetical protein